MMRGLVLAGVALFLSMHALAQCPAAHVTLVARDPKSAPLLDSIHELSIGVNGILHRSVKVQPEHAPGVVAVVFDLTGFLPAEGASQRTPQALKVALKKILKDLPESSPIAVYGYASIKGSRVFVFRDLAGNGSRIAIAPVTEAEIRAGFAICDIPLRPNKRSAIQFSMPADNRTDLYALQAVANHLACFAGRKAIVWVGPNWTPGKYLADSKLSEHWLLAMSTLQHTGTAIYPLPNELYFSGGNAKWAEITGGRHAAGYSKLLPFTRVAQADAQHYLNVTWEADCAAHRGGAQLPLTIDIPGHPHDFLLGPRFYFEPPPTPSLAKRLFTAESALATTLDARAIAVELKITSKTESSLTTEIVLRPDSPGPALFDLIYAFYDRAGNRIHAGKRDEIRLSKTEPEPIERIRETQPLPPGATVLRVAVRDTTSGALGSATVPLE